MEELLNEYELLLNKICLQSSQCPESEFAVFNAKVGKDYNSKLMVVGRAVNGWDVKSKLKKGFETTLIPNMLTYLKENTANTLEYYGGKYNPNKSSFTRLKQQLGSKIVGCSKALTNHSIVWSNLYKISNFEGGNPSAKLMRLQFEHCVNILKLEIELYKPETIILLTSYKNQWWAKPFLDRLQVVNILPKPIGFVEFAGMYNDIKVVVGQHPQGKNEALHLKNILDSLALIS